MFEQIEVNSERWFDLTPLLNEEFRDIEGFEGYYQISNYGRVKSLERKVKNTNSSFRIIKKKIIKECIGTVGYYYVQLCKENRQYPCRVHRLVAEIFLNKKDFKSMPNEDRSLIDLDDLAVNHRDENYLNNRIDNLEWCTYIYNTNYGTGTKRMGNKHRKSINQYDLEGNFIQKFDFINEASKKTNTNNSCIIRCCKNKQKTAGGYKWKYADDKNMT